MSASGGVVTVRLVGSFVAAITILTTSATLVAGAFQQQKTLRTVVSVPVTRLEIAVGTGDVSIRAAAPGQQLTVSRRVTWQLGTPGDDVTTTDGVTRVVGHCPGGSWFTSCSTDVQVQVPDRVAVRITDSTGDVDVTDTGAALDVTTTTGDVHLSGVTSADAAIHTTTGDVDAVLAAAPQALVVQTSVGDVTIHLPTNQSYQVRGNSSVGDRQVSVRTDAASQHVIDVSTSVGDVAVLPRS